MAQQPPPPSRGGAPVYQEYSLYSLYLIIFLSFLSRFIKKRVVKFDKIR